MTQLVNLKICHPHKNDNEFDVCVLPGDDFIVLYKCVKGGAAYTFATSTQCGVDTSTNHEIEANASQAFATTTYIDDATDKLAQENNFFDKYIIKNALPDGTDKPSGEQDISVNPFGNTSGQGNFVTAYQKKDVYPINIDGNTTGNSPLIQKEVNLLDFDTWANLPRNVKDGGSIGFAITDIEARLYNFMDPYMQNKNSSLIMCICFALLLLLPIPICFVKDDAYSLIFGWFLVGLLITRVNNIKVFSNTNMVIRFYPFCLLLALVLDLLFLIFSGVSGFMTILASIEFCATFAYTAMFWYKMVDIHQDSQQALLN